MNLSKLLLIHGALTFAAGVVLIAAPSAIPGAVGIHVEPTAYLICYLLGSCELGLAFLSFFSRRLTDVSAMRLVCWTFIVVHASTALVEVYGVARGGVAAAVWANVALRVLVVVLFAHHGIRNPGTQGTAAT
jgi:hypothetical protein